MDNSFDQVVNIVSLVLGIMNLQENLTQSDKQDIVNNLDNKAKLLLDKINEHLKNQDKKLDLIIQLLQEKIN